MTERNSRPTGYVALVGLLLMGLSFILPWWTVDAPDRDALPPLIGTVLAGETGLGTQHSLLELDTASSAFFGAVRVFALLFVVCSLCAVGLLWASGTNPVMRILDWIARIVMACMGALTAAFAALYVYLVQAAPAAFFLAQNDLLDVLDDAGSMLDVLNPLLEGSPQIGVYAMVLGGAIVALSAFLPPRRTSAASRRASDAQVASPTMPA